MGEPVGEPVYGVEFAPTAEAQKHALPMERRPAFDAAMRELVRDPRRSPAVQLGDGTWRVRLTQHVTLYYAVFQYRLTVLVMEVTDNKDSEPLYYE